MCVCVFILNKIESVTSKSNQTPQLKLKECKSTPVLKSDMQLHVGHHWTDAISI